jgi:hypothetical protein
MQEEGCLKSEMKPRTAQSGSTLSASRTLNGLTEQYIYHASHKPMAAQEISKEHFDSHNLHRKRPADNGVTKEVA